MQTKTGNYFVDYTNNKYGEPFKGTLICDLDDEDQTGIMPTIFLSPALIGTKQFYQDLREAGIDNIEACPVVIRDLLNNKIIDDYLVLNVIGRVACAVMYKSDFEQLNDEAGPDQPNDAMNFINDLVIDSQKVGNLDLFLVHEDVDCIIVSEKLYNHLEKLGYTDPYGGKFIFFEEVKHI